MKKKFRNLIKLKIWRISNISTVNNEGKILKVIFQRNQLGKLEVFSYISEIKLYSDSLESTRLIQKNKN